MTITAKAWLVALVISTVCGLISLICGGMPELLAITGTAWLISLAGAFYEAEQLSEKVWVPDKNMDHRSTVINMRRVSVRV